MADLWIVEDDPKIALLLEMAVKKAGHGTTRFADAQELDAALRKHIPLPDLLLLDLMLRAKNGFEVLKEWKEGRSTNEIPVIIISARSAELDKVKGLSLGAEDYITKPFGILELQARIATALRRLPRKKEQIRLGALVLMPDTHEVYVDEKPVELTGMEFELLLYLAEHAGEAIGRGELLKEVWGYATEDDPSRTVDSHIKTLRIKLGDTVGQSRFIRTVRGTGYRLLTGEGA